MGQRGPRLIERRSLVRERVRSARVHDVFIRRAGDRRPVRVLGDRQRDGRIEIGRARSCREIPAAERDRITLRHQERVCKERWVRHRARVVAAHPAIERVDGLCRRGSAARTTSCDCPWSDRSASECKNRTSTRRCRGHSWVRIAGRRSRRCSNHLDRARRTLCRRSSRTAQRQAMSSRQRWAIPSW